MASSGSFISSDGVGIGYRQLGSGPPLVLVHGGLTDHRCFTPILDELAQHFTVTMYDRRGRGLSGTGADHSLNREAADFVEAVTLAGDGDPVSVIGYSYGATCALHAVTTRPTPVRALVAYEAPFPVPGVMPADDEVLALIRADRRDEAVRLFVTSTFGLSPNAVQAMAAHPMWQVSLAAAAALPGEAEGLRSARLEPPGIPVPPIRYLVAERGGNPAFREIAELVAKTLPGADIATVPGLPHFAISTNPTEFVTRALEHLRR